MFDTHDLFCYFLLKLGLIDAGVFSHAGVFDTHDLFCSSLLKLGLIDAGVYSHAGVSNTQYFVVLVFAKANSSRQGSQLHS